MSATKFIEKTGKVKGKRQFKRFFLLSLIVSLLGMQCAFGNDHQPRFSTAGFYQVEGTGREVFSLNVAWRFHKGPKEHGESVDLDDSEWQVVSVPHGIEVLPVQASGGINYQGEVWYRKYFDLQIGRAHV